MSSSLRSQLQLPYVKLTVLGKLKTGRAVGSWSRPPPSHSAKGRLPRAHSSTTLPVGTLVVAKSPCACVFCQFRPSPGVVQVWMPDTPDHAKSHEPTTFPSQPIGSSEGTPSVGVGVMVGVRVVVEVDIAVTLAVAVAVGEGVSDGNRTGVLVAVSVAVSDAVGEALAEAEDVVEAVAVSVAVGVSVGVGDGVSVAGGSSDASW